MQKLNKIEIAMAADHRYQITIAGYGLDNGMKVAYAVWQLFKAERIRRKGIKK